MGEHEQAVSQLLREFSAGLPDRLERMRDALMSLEQAQSPDAIESIYLAAHSLNGTAQVYGADEVSQRAGDLSTLTGDWYDHGAVPVGELPTAAQHLERLQGAVVRFQRVVESGGGR